MSSDDPPTETGARRRTNNPDGLRRRVLDAAAAAFQSRGYQSATMQEIMAAAGATGGALHHHFPTKKAIGLAVIRERIAREVADTWIAPVEAAKTAREGVAAVFRAIIADLDRKGNVTGCPLNNVALELSLADPDFRLAIDDAFAAWRAAIAEKLRADGATDDAERLATLIVASYSGAMAMAKAGQQTAPLRDCAAALDSVLA